MCRSGISIMSQFAAAGRHLQDIRWATTGHHEHTPSPCRRRPPVLQLCMLLCRYHNRAAHDHSNVLNSCREQMSAGHPRWATTGHYEHTPSLCCHQPHGYLVDMVTVTTKLFYIKPRSEIQH